MQLQKNINYVKATIPLFLLHLSDYSQGFRTKRSLLRFIEDDPPPLFAASNPS